MTDKTDIESVIHTADVCRIALADGNIPYIIPMNFGYSGGKTKRLYFHCAREGRKLDMIKKNNYACFEMDVDHHLVKGEKSCDFTMKYRSVVGYGHITVIDDEEEKKRALNCIMSHYTDAKAFSYTQQNLGSIFILCLEISHITGKKC